MRHINEIDIHSTATRPDWWKSKSSKAKVAEIRRWHLARGWRDVGYHFLIDRDGTVVLGRPIEQIGAHIKGHNRETVAIALFGGYGGTENDAFEDNFTPEQDAALRELIAELKLDHPIEKIAGHNEYAAKACPTFRVMRWYKGKSPARETPAKSTTIQAVAGTAVAGAGGVFGALGRLDPTAQYIVVGFSCLALLGLGWIARERLHKWSKGVR